ncbi:hypothetical protein BDR03DRAFT_936104 [Suillus americanus]|nr:hypothetical protein BDR03DRAFT_936104 [Suillus americanus]
MVLQPCLPSTHHNRHAPLLVCPAILYTLDRGPIAMYSVHLKYALHVGGHQYVEISVVQMWRILNLVLWTSMSNCVHFYNVSLSKGAVLPPNFPFKFGLSGDHVWSGVVQLSLLEDLQLCGQVLETKHEGDHKDRFTAPIYGVTIGHPCCGIHNCHEPLTNNRDRFCSNHHLTHLHICAIVNSVPTNSDTSDVAIADLEADDPLEEEFKVPIVGKETTKQTKLRKLCTKFGRNRTHNEQLIIVLCGMILARETFYGAEGVTSIVEIIKRVFCDESIKPSHIFYNNKCTLSYHIRNDPYFKSVGLSVDVFHFQCKHSIEDAWCQDHCNPAYFDELQDASGNWLFNSSIAEQTNVWFGGYHSICHEMLMDRYVFFLDEMILQKNRLMKAKLHAEGRCPGNWPLFYNI